MDEREGRTEAVAMLALGSVICVAIAVAIEVHATGTAGRCDEAADGGPGWALAGWRRARVCWRR